MLFLFSSSHNPASTSFASERGNVWKKISKVNPFSKLTSVRSVD